MCCKKWVICNGVCLKGKGGRGSMREVGSEGEIKGTLEVCENYDVKRP